MLCYTSTFAVRTQLSFVPDCLLLEEGESECFCCPHPFTDNSDTMKLKTAVKWENCTKWWDVVRDDTG